MKASLLISNFAEMLLYVSMQYVLVPFAVASRLLPLIPSFPFQVLLILISKCRPLPVERMRTA